LSFEADVRQRLHWIDGGLPYRVLAAQEAIIAISLSHSAQFPERVIDTIEQGVRQRAPIFLAGATA